jgi:ribonuclease Z
VPPGRGALGRGPGGPTLTARHLEHTTDTVGYRLDEPDGVSLDAAALAARGIAGPAVGRLLADGVLDVDGRRVHVAEVSVPRPGQSVAFVMDTRPCDAVAELADGVDLLVIESTFLERVAEPAARWGHHTCLQAARAAAAAGVGHLVLTHFSQRYPDPGEYEREARRAWDGPLTVAADLDRVPLPRRRRAARS